MSPSSIELYAAPSSAFCRVVALTLDALKVDYEYKFVDLQKGEHLKPEYLELNPQHNVPTLKDGDLVLNESHAIAAYLVDTYGCGKSDLDLYPKCPKVRARIDQRMYFNGGVFYPAFRDVSYPYIFGKPAPADSARDRLREVLGWVESFVSPTGFAAGTAKATLADLALLATYSTVRAMPEEYRVDLTPFATLNEWFERVKAVVPNYEKANGEGAEGFVEWCSKL